MLVHGTLNSYSIAFRILPFIDHETFIAVRGCVPIQYVN